MDNAKSLGVIKHFSFFYNFVAKITMMNPIWITDSYEKINKIIFVKENFQERTPTKSFLPAEASFPWYSDYFFCGRPLLTGNTKSRHKYHFPKINLIKKRLLPIQLKCQ